MTKINKKIISVVNDGHCATEFGFREIDLEGAPHWRLSGQQSAVNFRLRSSVAGYVSDWHVAGDSTLIIILNGVIELEIRNGETRRFQAGELFVAEDFLKNAELFSDIHGHRARVIGSETFEALHLKLDKR